MTTTAADRTERLLTRAEVEDFLYREAHLLDTWQLDEWFALFTEDGKYVVPSPDHPHGNPDLDLALINDDHGRLKGRMSRLNSTWAHIENPHSRLCRLVTNVRVVSEQDDELQAAASFVVYRARRPGTSVYAGKYEFRLRRDDQGSLRIVRKFVFLVHESLRDSGGVLSIVL